MRVRECLLSPALLFATTHVVLPSGKPFPRLVGVYEVSGTYAGRHTDQAQFYGTLTIMQPELRTGKFGGTMYIATVVEGERWPLEQFVLQDGRVNHQGGLSFVLRKYPLTWSFKGLYVDATPSIIVAGRHTMDPTGAGITHEKIAGDWKAVRSD
jgi:hypothetical protein